MAQLSFDLSALPLDSVLHGVVAWPSTAAGRRALRVEQSATARPDQPSFVQLPVQFVDGTIQVDILSRPVGGTSRPGSGGVGLAYRIAGAGDRLEAAYLVPRDKSEASRPEPEEGDAVRYVAFPAPYPVTPGTVTAARNGRAAAGAAVGADAWATLTLHLAGQQLRVAVNGALVLALDATEVPPERGAIGLCVGAGTEAYFADLVVSPRERD